METLISDFISFFTVIDPIGTIPVFIAVTAGVNEKQKNLIANKAALTAAGILLFFIFVGEAVLDAVGIPLETFQIAGGIVLFLFSMTMIFGDSKPDDELKQLDKSLDMAIFPLAIPSLASPGAMLASTLLTKNDLNSFVDQLITASMMLLVVFIAWVFMKTSTKLFRLIGNGGASIISRVMGLILSAVAVTNILEGIKVYFGLE